MGSATARITAEDFVTPPEFRGLSLANKSAGQIGGVRVELISSAGATRLGAAYQQVPLRVLPPFQFPSDPAALLYLLNPTAGLLDGDAHFIEVTARPGTRAVVTGQSANRVHPARTGFATQQWHVNVAEDAQLVVLPGPMIPYRSCRYYQRVRIELEPGAKLLWGDIWLPGRYDRGAASEWFQFDRIIQDLEVRRGGELVFRERFDWHGPWRAADVNWFMGTGRATGSFFVSGSVDALFLPSPLEGEGLRVRGLCSHDNSPHPNPSPPSGEGLREQTANDRAMLQLASGDTVVRWCGSPGELTADLVSTAMTLAARWSGGDEPWLLSSSSFGPNHWFSVMKK